VLLSGGLDSSTALAIAVGEELRCHALTLRYGQRHDLEVEAARKVAASLGVDDHRILRTALGELCPSSSLVNPSLEIPRDRSPETLASAIPSTYVPARNTVFLAYALALAETTGAGFIYLGVNCVDFSGYPDCRPEYLDAFRSLAALATRRAVECRPPQIISPLLHMSKAEIIRTGTRLGVDYSLTLSCYDPDRLGRACGRCDACVLRRRGFAEAGVADPTGYQPEVRFGGESGD